MYRAVQDQLSLRSNGDSHPAQDVAELRKKTADYMRHHQDDFLPFLTQVCTQCTSPTVYLPICYCKLAIVSILSVHQHELLQSLTQLKSCVSYVQAGTVCYFVGVLPAECLPVLRDSWALQYCATVSHLQMICYDAA